MDRPSAPRGNLSALLPYASCPVQVSAEREEETTFGTEAIWYDRAKPVTTVTNLFLLRNRSVLDQPVDLVLM